MPSEFLVLTSASALAGVVFGFLISQIKNSAKQVKLQACIEQKQTQIEQLAAQQQLNENELKAANDQLHTQQTELALLKQQQQRLTSDLHQIQQLADSGQSKVEQLQQQLSATNEQLASSSAELHAAKDKASEYLQTNQLMQDRNATVETERNRLAEKLAKLQSGLSAKEEHFKQQMDLLEQQKFGLKQEFQLLANEILDAKSKAFNDLNKSSLDALLNPFKQQINDFKGKVENLHIEGAKQQTEMRTELKQLQAMHQQMTQEAHNLATALQGQKKMQGNWGELILENVLERSGLALGKDYQREDSFIDADGKRGRPDVVVYLPQDKHLIIDAKVSLNAYTRFINSEDKLERQRAINDHVKAISERIKELADRDYYKLNGVNSPEMVFMFVPIESAFVEAMKADETLFQKAIEQNVLVATPTTLLTSLNIVRQLWRFEDQNKHTAELAKKAEGVFKKLKTFLVSFEGIKKGLDTAQDSYIKAENQLLSGKGNLVKQVGEFKQLAPAIKDQLPQYFTEKADLELNHKPVNEE